MKGHVLVIEDNVTLGRNISAYLVQRGYTVDIAVHGKAALAQADEHLPDVVLIDYGLPDMNGLELLRQLREKHARLRAIMVTGHGSIDIAVEAMKSGAVDYLSKPVALSGLRDAVDKALQPDLPRSVAPVPQPAGAGACLDKLLGQSSGIRNLKDAVTRLLEAEHALKDRDRPTVLITGETGTGKALVARAIHDGGPRREGPFVELNCASLPGALVESELFGFERGAFTDARARKLGIVELAAEGTLFLDEIGELELAVQSKLLKLIEDRVTRRLGGLQSTQTHVRIVAATNRDLERQVALGLFRADLFYRLRIVHLHVPALRQRGDDMLLLARHFVMLHAGRYGKPALRLSRAAEEAIVGHGWPGNVRQLRNCLEHAVLMAAGNGEISPEQLCLMPMARPPDERPASDGVSLLPEQGLVLEEVEGQLMQQALARTRWNVTRAAKLLGVSRDTLRYRIEKFALKAPDHLA